MLDQLDRKTTVQKGGVGLLEKVKSKFSRASPAATAATAAPATPSAAATPAGSAAGPKEVPSKEPGAAPATSDAPSATPDAAPKEGPATNAASTPAAAAAPSSAPVNDAANAPTNAGAEVPAGNDSAAAAAAAAAAPTNAAPAVDAPAPAPPASGPKQKDTPYMDSNRLYRWIVSLLTGIWDWIKGLFTGAFSDKFEQLRKQFSADELFKLFGNEPGKIQKFTGEFKEHAEKLQRLVATGIGGAASASIDMILNAFSMNPVFGTTILVWRMFQNMLMIMGASLSVQAADSTFSTSSAKIADTKSPAESKGGGGKAKNNVTKRIKTDIRQLNRSLKRYMHFPHKQQGPKGMTAGSGYSYT
jgi:hypothetical protein